MLLVLRTRCGFSSPSKINFDTGQELAVVDPREYKLTALMEDQSSFNEYILLGRTYIDKRNYKAVEG